MIHNGETWAKLIKLLRDGKLSYFETKSGFLEVIGYTIRKNLILLLHDPPGSHTWHG
jgi:hypothetical protein